MYVPRCAGCKKRLDIGTAAALCEECLKVWEREKYRVCRHCGREVVFCTCCKSEIVNAGIIKLCRIVSYAPERQDKAVIKVIFANKKKNSKNLTLFLAHELARQIKRHCPDFKQYVITFVPRRSSAKSAEGYDHMEKVGRALAKELEISFEETLVRTKGAQEQKNLKYKERFKNAQAHTRLSANAAPAGKRYIIVDDVVTSGASISAAAKELRSSGAIETVGACIAVRI